MAIRHAVMEALARYSLEIHSVRLLARESNLHYRVTTTGGERYVLRIYSDLETTLQDNQVELFWLKALSQQTDLCVTTPVADRSGRYLNLVQAGSRQYRCALFHWAPGRSLSRFLTPRNYADLGRLLARLHTHAETLQLPPAIQPRRWDRIFYYPNEPDLVHDPRYAALFPPERLRLLDRVAGRAEKLLHELYAARSPMLIHGDLHFWNVRIHRGRLCALDFESVLLGYPLQDVAVTLYYGMERDDYPELSCALEDGYASLRPWPVKSPYQLETLWAARTLNFINYVARVHPGPDEYIAARCEDLQDYLERFG